MCAQSEHTLRKFWAYSIRLPRRAHHASTYRFSPSVCRLERLPKQPLCHQSRFVVLEFCALSLIQGAERQIRSKTVPYLQQFSSVRSSAILVLAKTLGATPKLQQSNLYLFSNFTALQFEQFCCCFLLLLSTLLSRLLFFSVLSSCTSA